jgi:hypothetical protein
VAHRRQQKPFGIVVAVALSAVFAGVVFWVFIRPSINGPQNRQSLTAFATRMKLGHSRDTVRGAFESPIGPNSFRFREYEPDCWAFETPLEFGARNWILVVSFGNDKVDGIGIRTADSLKDKPHGAPPDRVLESARSRWKTRFGPDRES